MRQHHHVLRAPAMVTVLLLATGCGYNAIQAKDEAVSQAAGQIKVQLQRRSDLIPNLVETVKGFASHETEVFTAVADARSKLAGTITTGSMAELAEANAGLTAPLGRLLALSENYPDLRSNQNFSDLQVQLEGTENRIAVARQDYNTVVADYNTYVRKFPYNLTAKMFGQGTPREYFDLTSASAADAPKVSF